jgi:hypothetical protein
MPKVLEEFISKFSKKENLCLEAERKKIQNENAKVCGLLNMR